MSAGLVRRRVNAGESGQSAFMREAAHIAGLGHELRAEDVSDAAHGHDDGEFGQLPGKAQHPGMENPDRSGNGVQLRDRFLNQQPGAWIFGEHGDQVADAWICAAFAALKLYPCLLHHLR